MLELEGLTFGYVGDGEQRDYRFALTVKAGTIACLTGRSGSGKSTCLDLIAGFLEPSGGSIKIGGQNVLGLSPGERPLTILFQQNNLFDHLTASDNVALGINSSLSLSEAERQKVLESLDRVGLSNYAEDPALRLSGGQRQRVALARSLARQRPVLLLDEPFSALDAETRDEMLILVREIVSDRNVAALMVTHDVRDCRRVADQHYKIVDDTVILVS